MTNDEQFKKELENIEDRKQFYKRIWASIIPKRRRKMDVMTFQVSNADLNYVPLVFKHGKDKYQMTDTVFDISKRTPRCISMDHVKDEIMKMQCLMNSNDKVLLNFLARSIIQETIFRNDFDKDDSDKYKIYITRKEDDLYQYNMIIYKDGEEFDDVKFNMINFMNRG